MEIRENITDYAYEILRLLSDGGWLTLEELRVKTGLTKRRLNAVLAALDKHELLDWENADSSGICIAFTLPNFVGDFQYSDGSDWVPEYKIAAAEAFVAAVKKIYGLQSGRAA